MATPIFDVSDRQKADFIINSKHSKLSDLISSEIKELAVVWCYYSGKIEGNTYTYVETAALLKDGITSEKKYEDAKMLKNLYNTFVGVLETIKKDGPYLLSEFNITGLHSMLTDGLVHDMHRGMLRTMPVRITGTEYIPPKDEEEIKNAFSNILLNANTYKNPLEKAVYLHCNIARLQPFIDGNKRTSRLIESIILMNADIIPVYSSKEADLLHYRKSLLHFYETKDYSQYVQYFLDRQITRINEIAPQNEQFKLTTDIQRSKGRSI